MNPHQDSRKPIPAPSVSPSERAPTHTRTGVVASLRGSARADLQAARDWYERLLGEPTFFPHATEAVWTLAENRSVYVVEHPDGAGNCVVTIFLGDLDGQVAAIADRGLQPNDRETYSNGVRKVIYRDPDGNDLGFGGAPVAPDSET